MSAQRDRFAGRPRSKFSARRRLESQARGENHGCRSHHRDQRDSTESFEDAIQQGVRRACETLRNVKSAWIKEQSVNVENDAITSYQANMRVTFVLE
jgi:flavin-binding protein dodecin